MLRDVIEYLAALGFLNLAMILVFGKLIKRLGVRCWVTEFTESLCLSV